MTAAVLTSLNEFQEAQWKEVSKKLLAKMIAEFLYEDLLKAEITGQRGSYKALSKSGLLVQISLCIATELAIELVPPDFAV